MVKAEINREEFIKQNLGLVHSICRRFAGRGLEYDDLYQAGCMGLVKAVDAYDFERGFAFSTYAVPVIMGEVRRLSRDGGAVKGSRSIKELNQKIIKVNELHNNLNKINSYIIECENILNNIDVNKLNQAREQLFKLQNKYQKIQNLRKLSDKLSVTKLADAKGR